MSKPTHQSHKPNDDLKKALQEDINTQPTTNSVKELHQILNHEQ